MRAEAGTKEAEEEGDKEGEGKEGDGVDEAVPGAGAWPDPIKEANRADESGERGGNHEAVPFAPNGADAKDGEDEQENPAPRGGTHCGKRFKEPINARPMQGVHVICGDDATPCETRPKGEDAPKGGFSALGDGGEKAIFKISRHGGIQWGQGLAVEELKG